jgi:2-polyprenyl-6-methoxyphenol hydroxylase-like FAD-dependent oxidoreductase
MSRNRILISGAGIAGLTLAIELKRNGLEPVVIDRQPAPRAYGHLLEFFGTGWDIATRLKVIEPLRAIKYPVETLAFVGDDGGSWFEVPFKRIRAAFGDKYAYLRRNDILRVLGERAGELGIDIRYGTGIHALIDRGDGVHTTFVGGAVEDFDLVVGTDGARSRVRMLAFGPDRRFVKPLGLHMAAFSTPQNGFPLNGACKFYEELDRTALLCPLDDKNMDGIYVFRQPELDAPENLTSLRQHYEDAGWITSDVLRSVSADARVSIGAAVQIVMPEWHRGRFVLVGDACGALGLQAGPGVQMAMAGAYVLARELVRHADHRDAFAAYQAAIKPSVDRKQKKAQLFADLYVPKPQSRSWLRRLATKAMFSPLGLSLVNRWHGAASVLTH